MRTSIYTILGIIGIILIVVMAMALTSMTDFIPETPLEQSAKGIDRYIPMESSVWSYSNGESYKKLMVTEQVFESDKFKHIVVKGEEDDESIKSYRDNYVFEYTYKVEEDKLTRSLHGNVLLDGYKDVTLLKLPLEEGNTWQDNWVDLKGNFYTVTSKIKSIMEEGQIITVQSTDRGGRFIIERTLEVGKGVTAFNIVEKYDDIEFETGYELLTIEEFEYKGFDNYMALLGNEKIGTTIDTINESSEKILDKSSESLSNKEESTTESFSGVEIPIQENDEIDEEVRLAIENSVKTFNEKWVLFINEGDMSIMDTIAPNASVEKIIDVYKDKEMTQRFLTVDVKRIVLRGDIANAYVYEEIERHMDGDTKVLVYNWIYEIDKIDGKWLIEGYIENKNL